MDFEFNRGRGVVWVCDIAGSSRHLNDDKTAGALETFIPRLHWAGAAIVEAAGGTFVKWTGDGFLAWFDVQLHRDIPRVASIVFEAIWHLSFLVNVTQLGVQSDKAISLRHGVAFEHDALVTKILHPSGHRALDITGRGVVLAFRLSGVPAAFPCVVSSSELTNAYKGGDAIINFQRWTVSRDDRLKYFKGERWGTSALVVSSNKKYRKSSAGHLVRKAKASIDAAEGRKSVPNSGFVDKMLAALASGPDWCQPVVQAHSDFIKNKILHTLKDLAALIDAKRKPVG